MNDALHAAASAMNTRIRALDVGAQNMINAATPGYQKRVLTTHSFQTALDREFDRDPSMVGTTERIAFTQGRFAKVDDPLSAAIQGQGFFVVDTPAGEGFTRNGDFMMGRDGTIMTRAGYPVMGENGPIQANLQGGPVRFGQDGAIMQDNAAIGRVRVVEFNDRSQLKALSETIFTDEGNAGLVDAADSRVLGQYVELPSQSALTSMVAMIAANHQYDSAQRLMSTVNRAYQRLSQQQTGR